MESKRSSPEQRPSRAARVVRAGLAAVVSLVTVAALATGCLDRPVAEQEPNTSNIFVDQSVRAGIDRIDLLFMIDNSASMQDKQVLMSQAVPVLLNRLLNPPCVDANTKQFVEPAANPDAECPSGTEREFMPVPDVHIGVVSSSIGGHGHPTFCEGAPGQKEGNDHAQLIGPLTRPGLNLVDYNGQGFLAWDNRDPNDRRKPNPPGEANLGALVENFQNYVTATGEIGCGFEAQLESWYRFLIDPAPPAAIKQAGDITVKEGIDTTILTQRKAFLRPDSLVAIIMLTDENDCSIQDSGYGWIAGNNQISLGTTACDTNPNDKCCTYCGFASAPPGCPEIASDAKCQLPKDNAQNVRCWDQKRRFGIDFLYPTSRYSTALDSVEICPDSTFPDADCACRRAKELDVPCDPGKPTRNPLYADLPNSVDGQELVPGERVPGLVFLAGIVGVPWQDLATDDTLQTPDTLVYKRSTETRWDYIYGTPDTAAQVRGQPADPLMIESTTPRSGTHPIINVGVAPPESSSPLANPINGHEWNPQNQEDLQYACIFDLAPVQAAVGESLRDCNVIAQQTCDCFDPSDDLAGVNLRKKPLCHSDSGYSSVQVRAKAYPGLREIDVLRRYGENSIVASICPKVLTGETNNPNYGYNPAVSAIIERLKEKLAGRCLPRRLSADPATNRVPCEVIEAMDPARGIVGQACETNRSPLNLADPADQKLDAAVRRALERNKRCGPGTNIVDCGTYQLCKMQQLTEPGGPCLTQVGDVTSVYGYCYIDEEQQIGAKELVANCPASERRILRFVGVNVPAPGATVFIACAGDTFSRSGQPAVAPPTDTSTATVTGP